MHLDLIKNIKSSENNIFYWIYLINFSFTFNSQIFIRTVKINRYLFLFLKHLLYSANKFQLMSLNLLLILYNFIESHLQQQLWGFSLGKNPFGWC